MLMGVAPHPPLFPTTGTQAFYFINRPNGGLLCTRLYSLYFPLCSNAWPPLQEIIVTGLENTGDAKALDIAKKLVEKWLRNVYVSYVQSEKKMFEKYDVEEVRKRSYLLTISRSWYPTSNFNFFATNFHEFFNQ